jgi:hypothetical protein
MNQTYSSEMGVSEISDGFNDSLRRVGQQDKDGRTIGIAYFANTGLRIIPLVLRAFGFVALFALLFMQQPFSWLPVTANSPAILLQLQQWQMFSLWLWSLALLVYTAYYAVSLWKNGIYTGQPGMEIHFERHRKVVRTIKPGEKTVILDPRIRPSAVVSTKPFVLLMEPVEGTTRENMSLTYRGALLLRVVNTAKLLERGGFDKFLSQASKIFASMMKDAILGVSAAEFNKFFIDPVTLPALDDKHETITQRLSQLENSDLSVELLMDTSDVDELDVSKFDLAEPATPARKQIIAQLQRLGDEYGIKIMDHVPAGNLTSEEYLKTLALPLVSSIARLDQATGTLDEIVNEEIEEDIAASVAGKRLGVLEIEKIIKQIESITSTLRDEKNVDSIVDAKQTAIANLGNGLLADVASQIESLSARVQAKTVDTTAIELYMTELEAVYTELETQVEQFVPEVRTMVVEGLTENEMVASFDIVAQFFDKSGTKAALDKLKAATAKENTEDAEMGNIEKDAQAINVQKQVEAIQLALVEVSGSSGISTDEYSPKNVSAQIEEIARRANVDVASPELAETTV